MEKLSKTWKWVIVVAVVVGVLIIIDISLDTVKRASQNEGAVRTEQLNRKSIELRDQDEAAQRLYDLRDKISRKVNAWNQGVESDWAVYRNAVDEIEYQARVKAHDEGTDIDVGGIKSRVKDWTAANTRYTLAKFYGVFGEPNLWVPSKDGVLFYYKYKDGDVQLELSNERAYSDEVFCPIYIVGDSVDRTDSISSNLRLAREGSFQPLKEKTLPEIRQLFSDWLFNLQSTKEEKSSKKPIETFYDAFGEPDYLRIDDVYYSFYYECKVRKEEYIDSEGLLKDAEIKDGIVELQMTRRDFDERGTVNIEIRSVFEPSKLVVSINKM